MIAVIRGTRVVRRIIRPSVPAAQLDADIVGWLNIMATCHDNDIITYYARTF